MKYIALLKMRKYWRCGIVCLSLGLLFVVLGLVLIPLIRLFIKHMIVKEVTLNEGTFVYKAWKDPPFPLFFEFYFFDVLNPQEVVQDNATIAVRQLGPYTYRVYASKTNITFNDNGTVSYIMPMTFVFDRSRSVGSESDTFTTVNFVLVTMMNTVQYENDIIKLITELLADSVSDDTLFITRSVRDIIWGYTDPIFHKVKDILHRLDDIPFDDQFGFFYKLNTSNDGLWNVDSGKRDATKNFNILQWNGQSMLDSWTTKQCNMMNGTDGNIFHPFLTKSDQPELFFSQLCRSMTITYQRETTVQGIDTYRFVHPRDLFANPAVNPNNAGFCTPAGNCLPRGMYNISVCKKGAPFSVSMPHFLYADPILINGVRGMKPDASLHEPFLDIMPDIGVLLRTERKYQLNIFIKNLPSFRILKNIKDVHFPVLWFNESTIVTDSWANFIKTDYQLPVTIASWMPYILMIVGGLITLVSSVSLYRIRRKSKVPDRETSETSPLLTEEDDRPINLD